MSQQYIHENLRLYSPVSDAAKKLHAVTPTFVNLESQPESEEGISCLQEDLPPSVLYCPELSNGPSTLYRLLKDYLALNGVPYNPHPSVRRII